MPRNMGSLYWQLDDCWPVASWSSIDYFGRWKALQYYAKRFYSPVLLSPHVDAENLNFYVVSDLTQSTKALLNVELWDLEGNKLVVFQRDVAVAPLQNRSYFSVPVSNLLSNRDSKNLMIYCELIVDGKVVSNNEYFFEPFKALALPMAQINFEAARVRNGYKITLTTDKLAKAVYLSTKTDGFFSDNYFDLLPGKPLQVEFRTRLNIPLEEFRNQLKIRSLKDAFTNSETTVTNK
jgi:beta-mannosidase